MIEKITKKRLQKKQEKEVLEAVKKRQEEQEKAMEKLKAEADFLKPIIKEKFWPIIKDKNIYEADTLCQLMSGRVKEYFQGLARKLKVKELGLEEIFNEGDEGKVLTILEDLTIDQSLKVVEGMSQAIMACIRREQKTRKMTELKELVEEFK